jgi:undecaprenyl-diphosphatase
MRRYSDLFYAGMTALGKRDAALALAVNHWSEIAWVRGLLRGVSRLGDGVFWYALMASLLAAGREGAIRPVLQMLVAGTIGFALYKVLKRRTLRPRPYAVRPDIRLCGVPLDHYSFPSGHTLHAVGLSFIATTHFPILAPLLLPFTVLVALSRVVLGLHYPSDVAAGALLGGGIAVLTLSAF